MMKIENVRGASATESAISGDGLKATWSGTVSEEELAKPGGMLMAALLRCAQEKGLSLMDMAKELCITYGYINSLRNGVRQINQIGDDFALTCARFLGVPRLTVLMLAGRISSADLFEHESFRILEISRAMAYIRDDPEWGPMVTPELFGMAPDSQFGLVKMYEKATGKVLLSSALNPQMLAIELDKVKAIQATRIAAGLAAAARKVAEQEKELA